MQPSSLYCLLAAVGFVSAIAIPSVNLERSPVKIDHGKRLEDPELVSNEYLNYDKRGNPIQDGDEYHHYNNKKRSNPIQDGDEYHHYNNKRSPVEDPEVVSNEYLNYAKRGNPIQDGDEYHHYNNKRSPVEDPEVVSNEYLNYDKRGEVIEGANGYYSYNRKRRELMQIKVPY
ncbi:hypothetical protein PFICI_01942 [Pestalotiopsis fici W106-1]|uniref:Uncharacterized protein n=1 Tax=Pestalotiopsis fici (strain W106-1 / CGMCC3.15140) TaxID=1229662 RepID=W3XQ47_PESFW|nr:uncharacterized protein PFICI_01942 [Pestalotiopsis fici W106-1]ETS88114.1 hypothetical protein PFICI_01942 [Pestalotiopsis fici W106-1]